MAHHYLAPKIAWLPGGYRCSVVSAAPALAATLRAGRGRVVKYWRVYRDGKVAGERRDVMTFVDGRLQGAEPPQFLWPHDAPEWTSDGGFVEFGADSADGTPIFASAHMPALYVAYSAPGRKGFFTCIQYKFGEPRVIGQIAEFGRFVDAYPIVHIDRARGFSESLAFVNPYSMPLVAEIQTQDGRRVPRVRVPPLSARRVPLDSLLRDGETRWEGQIQVTASNRVVTYTVKHAADDPADITTVEHMDPFRADATHVPAFQWLRLRVGDLLADLRDRRG